MADTAKGNSAADTKKKTTALDEDFGKDFLSFWGSSKKGKDNIDFDTEEVPRNTKKSFNFDKLDNFELGGDFDKLPSFKMDMPDLDFSSPSMNNEKPTEKQIGKKESRKENFSFNFDFNELDKFDLDSSPSEINKKSSKGADTKGSDYSYKHAQKQDSRSKSDTSANAFNDLKNTKPLNTENQATSRPDNLTADTIIKDTTTRPSISQDLEHHDISYDVQTSTAKQILVADGNKNDNHSNEGHLKWAQETGFKRTNVEKTTQDFILQSVSADCSAQEDNPQVQTRPASSDVGKIHLVRKQDDSARTVDSSKSRNSSPVNSYNTKHNPETSMIKASNISGDFQKHREWNQNGGGKDVRNNSMQGQMGIQDAFSTDFPQNIATGMMNTGDKQNSGSEFIISPLRRGSIPVNPKSLNDKVASALQLNSLKISAENTSWKTAAKRQQGSVHDNKLKMLDCPVNNRRESNQNRDQAEPCKAVISNSHGEGSIRGISDISRSERVDDQSDTSSLQVKYSDLQQTTATKTAQTGHDFLSSTTSSRTVPVELSHTSLNDERKCDNILTISSLKKLNNNTTNSATPKQAKSVMFSERRLGIPLKTPSNKESTDDLENLKPVKPSMESASGRKAFEVPQKVEGAAIPEPENLEADRIVNYGEDLASNSAVKLGSKMNKVQLSMQKDGQSEKTKKPDDTYSTNDNLRTVDSSQSRNTSPDNSYNSRCCRELCVPKSASAGDGFQGHHQGSHNEVTGEMDVLSEPNQCQMETQDASFTNISEKIAYRMKNYSAHDNQNVHTEAIPSSLQRDGKAGKPLTMKEKVIAAIQSKSFSKSVENVPLKSSAIIQKELSLDSRKLKALNISPLNEGRFSKHNPEQALTQKVGILKLYEKGLTKGVMPMSRVQNRDTSRFHLKTSSLPQQTVASNTVKNIIPKLASGIASVKSSEILLMETNDSSIDDITFDNRLTTTSIPNLEGKTQATGTSKEVKSTRFSESNSEFPLNTTSMANSIPVNNASLAPHLKRKTLEDSTNDPNNSISLKRLLKSPIGRKPLEVSPKTESRAVLVTGSLEASRANGLAEDLNANGVTEAGALRAGLEVLPPLEKDEIAAKAEAYSKELDDMCGMLRKKHEEARELLVRAVVNNNTLQMLKHPLLDEKIHSLQRFAASLSEKF